MAAKSSSGIAARLLALGASSAGDGSAFGALLSDTTEVVRAADDLAQVDGIRSANWSRVSFASSSSRASYACSARSTSAARFRALRDRQITEAMEADEAYDDTGYVVTDQLGAPLRPERYTDFFLALAGAAGLPRIRLHDVRHTANSLMAAAGVPPHIRAAWCGHTRAVNEDTYTHAQADDMTVALAALRSVAENGA